LRTLTREAPAALLLLLGCAGAGASPGAELDALRAEVRALRRDNAELSQRVDALANRVEILTTLRRADPRAEAGREGPPTAALAPVVPPDLSVVKVAPPTAPRARRVPPPLPTVIPIAEPDPERLEALSRRTGRELAAEAEGELRAARAKAGVARAHALEDFAARFPRHPGADNALAEGASAYADAGRDEAACMLARRAEDEYPAGDAMSDVVERLAWCASRSGDAAEERRLLERVVAQFPKTPAATRAGTRLAALTRSGS
jgi:TolA-binding protein